MTPTRAKSILAGAPVGAADVITDDGAWSDAAGLWLVQNGYAIPTMIELTADGEALRNALRDYLTPRIQEQ